MEATHLQGKPMNRSLATSSLWILAATAVLVVALVPFDPVISQRAQGLPIAIVEEIAYENGWISKEELLESAERYGKSPYGKHLKDVAEGKVVIVPND